MRRALSRASSESPKTCARPSPRRKSPAALARLETSYAEPLTPVELVRIAKLPAARFARIIKRIMGIMGITPIQLISKTRLAAASRLLREKGRSVRNRARVRLLRPQRIHPRLPRRDKLEPTQFRTG